MNIESADHVFFRWVCGETFYTRFGINDLQNDSPQTPVKVFQEETRGSEPRILQKIEY
jgi:hypothetical protein